MSLLYGLSLRYRPSPDRVPYDPSHGDGLACRIAHRVRRVVACGIVRRRIACGTARRRIVSRRIPARVSDLRVPAVFPAGRAERPSSAMSRPNSACHRRRLQRFTNMYSFPWPSRFSMAPSAARLRRTVGPLSRHGACRTGEPMTPLRYTVPNSPGSRT